MENERIKVILINYGEPTDFLKLTKDQMKLLEYLYKGGYLDDNISYDGIKEEIVFKDI